jgi:hypothetical protein
MHSAKGMEESAGVSVLQLGLSRVYPAKAACYALCAMHYTIKRRFYD